MSNYVLGYADIGFNAGMTGGVWRDNLGLEMLARQLLTAAARTVDLSELVIDITLQSSQETEVLGICNHNLSTNGTYQWQCFSDPGRTVEVYNSGVIQVHSYFDSLVHKTTCDATPGPIENIYWRLTVNDTNADGYMEIGRLFMGQRFNASYNMDYGLKFGIDVSNTQVEESTVGIEAFVQSIKRRTASFAHRATSHQIGTEHLRLQIREGISNACLFDFNPEDKGQGERVFIGRHQTLSPLDYPSYNLNSVGFNIVEII